MDVAFHFYRVVKIKGIDEEKELRKKVGADHCVRLVLWVDGKRIDLSVGVVSVK